MRVGRTRLTQASVVVLTVCALFLALVASGAFRSPAPTICDTSSRTELLNARLDNLQLSQPFTLKPGSRGWIQLTTLPGSYESLFGNVAGAAELHSVRSGAAPNLITTPNGYQESHDPSIIIAKVQTWQQLPMGPGDWQLYSFSDPGIELVSCPAS